MPKVRREDNLNCPYCGTKQENLYGSGSDCKDCGKYFKIGVTNGGYTTLWKVNANLKYRIIREQYKVDCNKLLDYLNNDLLYFKTTRVNKDKRNDLIKYADSIGMKSYKIFKFHKDNGSNLSLDTILRVIKSND